MEDESAKSKRKSKRNSKEKPVEIVDDNLDLDKKEKEKIVESPRKKIDLEDDDDGDVEDVKDDIEPGGNSPLATCAAVMCFPFTLCCSWFVLNEKEEAVILNCGKFTGVESTPGCHYRNCWGRDVRRVSKQIISLDTPNVKVVDKRGNPLIVSGIVVYHIANSKKASLDVLNAHQFIGNEAQGVLKRIVSMYPYEAHEEHGEDEEISLKTEATEISKKMVKMLQKAVATAGAKIHSFQFNEMSYAPEIAQGMLKKQQARATIAARKKIVQGAVEIAYGAVDKLQERGVKMQQEEKTQLVRNLLTVICGETENQGNQTAAAAEGGYHGHRHISAFSSPGFTREF